MSFNLDLTSSRTARVLDAKSERAAKFLPYLRNNKLHPVNFKVKSKRSITKQSAIETHVRRYEQNEAITVLSIRFAESEQKRKEDKQQEMYIKRNNKSAAEQNNQEQKQQRILPYLRYRKYQSPEQRLRSMGYDPDVRLPQQIYSQKVEQRKFNYVNKLQSLKRQMQNCTVDKRHNRMQKSRIQVKLLGEQIRRKRERELLIKQQRKGHRLLESLLNQDSCVTA